MKTIRTYLLLFALLGVWGSSAFAQTYKTEAGHVEFTSKVPLHTFTGTSEQLTGLINLEDGTVDFFVDLETLDTGMRKRDKDMKITLETKEYPFAEFFGKLTSPVDHLAGWDEGVAAVTGNFTLHGVTREVTVEGTLRKTTEGLLLKASWQIRLDDYDIVPPSLLIVKVDEVQEVAIEAILKPVEDS